MGMMSLFTAAGARGRERGTELSLEGRKEEEQLWVAIAQLSL